MLISSWKSVVCYQKVLHNLHISILVRFYFFWCSTYLAPRSHQWFSSLLPHNSWWCYFWEFVIGSNNNPLIDISFILITFLLYIGRRNCGLEFVVNTTVIASFCRTISLRLHGVNIEETIDMWRSHVLLASDPCCSWLLAQLGSSNNS